MQEPLEAYNEVFETYQGVLENLIESTVDLTRLREEATNLLTDPASLEALRFITGPFISADDLKTLAEATLTGSKLKADPAMVERIIDVLIAGLDRRRFPWVTENREANAHEREAAVLATAALIATSRTTTMRRNEGKKEQEQAVETALLEIEFKKVHTRTVETMSQAPGPGEFCRESKIAGRKADFIIGLFDGRTMPLECKVSNSSTNSVKRLNNDAAVKAVQWVDKLGSNHAVPAAMLSGVFKLHNLEDAQDKGLSLFWAHDLQAFTTWILATRTP
jgi:hypothetical protein